MRMPFQRPHFERDTDIVTTDVHRDFLKIVEPSLTERNQKYEWSVEQEEAFQTLKNDLCDTPIKRIKATWFRATDGKKRRREFVIYGSNLGSIDAAESVRDAIGFEYCLASSSGWTKGTYESDFGGYNEGMYKVVLIKEKLKAARDRQKSYVDFRRKPLESEVGDRVLSVLGNSNLHVTLNEIKIDKTLRFVEEPVKIINREIKSLKRSGIPLVKIHWNSKRDPEFHLDSETIYMSLIACRDLEAAVEYPGDYRDDKKDVRKSG
ncbi:hypothetical protein Tco_0637519 [Tanacetum coccineum]